VDPGDKKAQLDLSFALLRYSNTLRAAGDLAASLRAMNEARQLFDRLHAEDPGNTRLEQNLASLHHQYSELFVEQRQWEQAVSNNNAAVAISERLLRADPRDAASARMLLECFMLRPRMFAGAGRQAEAIAAATKLEGFAQSGLFAKSKEPRLRSVVARAFEIVAQYVPARSKELLARSEAEWAAMEKEGLLVPALAAERDSFRKRLAGARN
jgi:tetratricopeptide (TPR) repeat protein